MKKVITKFPEKLKKILFFGHFWAKINFLKKLGSVSFQILQLAIIIQKNPTQTNEWLTKTDVKMLQMTGQVLYGTLARPPSSNYMTYNHCHNTLRHFDIFLSPQVKQSTIISNKHGIHDLPYKLPHELRLRSLEIEKYQENLKTS